MNIDLGNKIRRCPFGSCLVLVDGRSIFQLLAVDGKREILVGSDIQSLPRHRSFLFSDAEETAHSKNGKPDLTILVDENIINLPNVFAGR